MRAQIKTIMGMAMLFFSANALAVTISLIPPSTPVAVGEEFTVDLFMDANSGFGDNSGVYSGQVEIKYDPAQLSQGTPSLELFLAELGSVVTGESDGRKTVTYTLNNISLNTSPYEGTVGRFNFKALTVALEATINIADGNPQNSWIYSESDYPIQPFIPTFIETSIAIVPLPGALWLMLSGLGVLGLVRRKA